MLAVALSQPACLLIESRLGRFRRYYGRNGSQFSHFLGWSAWGARALTIVLPIDSSTSSNLELDVCAWTK